MCQLAIDDKIYYLPKFSKHEYVMYMIMKQVHFCLKFSQNIQKVEVAPNKSDTYRTV